MHGVDHVYNPLHRCVRSGLSESVGRKAEVLEDGDDAGHAPDGSEARVTERKSAEGGERNQMREGWEQSKRGSAKKRKRLSIVVAHLSNSSSASSTLWFAAALTTEISSSVTPEAADTTAAVGTEAEP